MWKQMGANGQVWEKWKHQWSEKTNQAIYGDKSVRWENVKLKDHYRQNMPKKLKIKEQN